MSTGGQICEPITVPMCQGLSYTQTITPNLLGHTSQREAMMKMSFFNVIVKTLCSEDIRLFLCMAYVPRCEEGGVRRPCRALCERAKQGCVGLMTSYGVSWPDELSCDTFPEDTCATVSNVSLVSRGESPEDSPSLFTSVFFAFTGRQQTQGKPNKVVKVSGMLVNVRHKHTISKNIT